MKPREWVLPFGLLLASIVARVSAMEPGRCSTFPAVADDRSLAVMTLQMQAMTRDEHPLARAERLAHDYVYAATPLGYQDPRLHFRMKADGLSMLESFYHEDGTAGMVVRDDKTGQVTVVFRGSDDKLDNARNAVEVTWNNQAVGSTTYDKHRAVWDDWAAKYGSSGRLAVAGHSRGGGLAALFTANHCAKVKQLVMFQSPGQNLEEHKKFREQLADWPDTTLVVAATDVVQLPGQRHIGEPTVIVGTASDMDRDKIFGHGSFLLQNPYTTDFLGELYRNPGDGLLIATLSHYEYARLRVGAVFDPEKFRVEWDTFDLLYPKMFLRKWLFNAASVTSELLAEASVSSEILIQIIKQENLQPSAARTLDGNLPGPDASLFDHVLPPEFHAFEAEFFRLFEEMVRKDLAEIEQGVRTRPRLPMGINVMHFIAARSVPDYLEALKTAFEDLPVDPTALDPDAETPPMPPGGVPGRDAATRYQMRIRLIQEYYELQRAAFFVLQDMFSTGYDLVAARIAPNASRLADVLVDLERSLLDAAQRAAVKAQAEHPPQPEGSGGIAQQQAKDAVQQQVSAPGRSGLDISTFIRAYEELHEDLFVDALSYPEFADRSRELKGLIQRYWDSVSLPVRHDQRAQAQITNAKKDLQREMARIDHAFETQARSRLAKLDLLLQRYRQAGIVTLLEELRREVDRAQAGMEVIASAAPAWYNLDRKALIRTESDLARQAPAGTAEGMPWLAELIQTSESASLAATKLQVAISDWLETGRPRIDREQDYVLSLLELYLLESARRTNLLAYQAARGGVTYPDGMTLRREIEEKVLAPLSDTLLELLRIQALLGTDYVGVPNHHRRVADTCSKTVAYFGDSYRRLLTAEKRLLAEYLSVKPGLRQGSASARPQEVNSAGPDARHYTAPALRFNGQILCIPRYACEGDTNTDDYLHRLGEQLRRWQTPDLGKRSNSELGILLAPIPEHLALAGQFPAALAEVDAHLERIAPLHAEYLALVAWRGSLRTSYQAHIASQPLLMKIGGDFPAAFALTTDCAREWPFLHADYQQHLGRQTYLRDTFLPGARKLIADLEQEEHRIRGEIDSRLAEVTAITQEITTSPNLSVRQRAAMQDRANKQINWCLAMHAEVATYAPFKADYATPALAAQQGLQSATAEPVPTSGAQVTGFVFDKRTQAPIPGATVRWINTVRSAMPKELHIVTDTAGRFTIDAFPAGRWECHTTAPGYQTHRTDLAVAGSRTERMEMPMVRLSAASHGQIRVVLHRDAATQRVPVNVSITDKRGRLLFRGEGPHKLPPGDYIVTTRAQYCETDPASARVQLFAGEQAVVEVSVRRARDEEEPEVVTPPARPTVPAPVYDQAVADLCGSDAAFVRSLYQCILHRDPPESAIQANVARLQSGVPRRHMIAFLFASPEYENQNHHGDRFMTDVYQSIFARQPTARERQSRPRMSRRNLVTAMFDEPGHLAAVKPCASRWGAEGASPATSPDLDQENAVHPANDAAYAAYIEAYNALTRLMAAGKGDTPEGRKAYADFAKAKAVYDAQVSGSTAPPTR